VGDIFTILIVIFRQRENFGKSVGDAPDLQSVWKHGTKMREVYSFTSCVDPT
jgi:hypothetical protein